MKLDNFELVKFNQFNIEHEYIMNCIFDKRGSKYLSDYKSFMEFFSKCSEDVMFVNVLYLVLYNKRFVGFISLVHQRFGYEVISGMMPNERGKKLGALLLQEFSEEVFEKYPSIDRLHLKIHPTNMSAIKTAQLVGYRQLNSETFVMDSVPVSKKSR